MIKKSRIYSIFVCALIILSCFSSYWTVQRIRTFYAKVLPNPEIVKSMYPVAVRKEGRHIIYDWQKNRPTHWIALRSLSKKVVSAVLLSEDSDFFHHHGYSPEAIRAAIEYNHRPGVKIKRGGSTITQQVVKNLFLTPEKTITRKVRELLLAVDMERKLSKAKILETYLNIAEWGPGIYGIQAASHRYFQKNATELSAREAAMLAFMLPNPNRYQYSVMRDDGPTDFAERRIEAILDRMWKTGHISDEERGITEPLSGVEKTAEESASSQPIDALPSEL